jgi:citrate synthase
MKTLLDIGEVANVESYVKRALAEKRKMMGFGHAVYKTEDPRATHLRQFSKEMGERSGNSKWYDMSLKVEEVMMREKGLLSERPTSSRLDLLHDGNPRWICTLQSSQGQVE